VKIKIQKRRGARIEMLPLIDIVFLLLVFFIYAMLSMAVHRALPIALPTSETAEIDNLPQIAISVTVDGAIFIDKELVEMRYLTEVLENKTEVEKKKGVQVFADRLVEYQRLFMVLDSIKNAGISNISLQAERDGGS
jgi:biopolymer transport protein ExbD